MCGNSFATERDQSSKQQNYAQWVAQVAPLGGFSSAESCAASKGRSWPRPRDY